MMKEKIPAHDKYEHAANMNWLRVIASDADAVKSKSKTLFQ